MKRYIMLAALMLGALSLSAQYRVSDKVNHFLTLSLGAGTANTITSLTPEAPLLKSMPGADGLFSVTYELRKDRFIFGLGAQFDYDFTWQRADSFYNSFDGRVDREGDAVRYDYVYHKYRDLQSVPQVSVPLYFGGNIGDYVYLLVGAKFSFPIMATHTTKTLLATQGTYERFIHTIRNAPTYGYYYQDSYKYKSSFSSPMKISPMLEVGARIPVDSRSRRVGMRLGAYIEYAIPLSHVSDASMIDYSNVDENPATMNQQNLRDNIIFNSVLNCNYQKRAFSELTVGVKWTVLFNLTKPDKLCMCDADL